MLNNKSDHLIIMNNEFIMIRLYLEPWKVHMNLTEEAKLHCNFGCIFSPLHCVFHLPERRHGHIDCIFYFSPLCVFKCLLKLSAFEDAKSQCNIGCIFSPLHCVFSNVASNHLPEKRHSHIGCICLTFLHCVFSNVPSKR